MWLYQVLRLIRIPCRLLYGVICIGRENIPKKGPALICSNHIHWIDPFIHGLAQRRSFWSMAKEELFKSKLSAFLIKSMGGFPIRRGKNDVGAMENAEELLRQGKMVAVFPEGHRSETGILQDYKPGVVLLAHHTGSPIIPSVIATKKPYRLFGPVKVIYGKPMTSHELGVTSGERSQLRHAARKLRDIAQQMLDGAIL